MALHLRYVAAALTAVTLSAGLGGCTRPVDRSQALPAAVVVEAPTTTAPAPDAEPTTTTPTTTDPTRTEPEATTTTTTDPRVAGDRAAGVLSNVVPPRASGQLKGVPGAVAAPNPAAPTRRTVSFVVEDGLDVDGTAFSSFALATLNDRRSWSHDGYTFEQVPEGGDIVVTLASPQVSQELCRPLSTQGTMSCSQGRRVTLTWFRWVNGQEEFGGDLTTYRQYLINHEVGHSLGHGHEQCPGKGAVAPVMMQQTLGLKGCRPGPWPYPEA